MMSAPDNAARVLSHGVAIVRLTISGLFLARPIEMMSQLYGEAAASSKFASLAARHFVVRDFLLGLGLWRALHAGPTAQTWMLAGTLADLFDLATIAAVQSNRTERAKLLAGMAAIVSTDAVLTALLRERQTDHGR